MSERVAEGEAEAVPEDFRAENVGSVEADAEELHADARRNVGRDDGFSAVMVAAADRQH